MKKYILLFSVLSFQAIFSQNNETLNSHETPIYDAVDVDKKPDFPGGIAMFYQYVGKNFIVPEHEKPGKIYTKFVIEIDGSVTNIDVVRDEVGGKNEAIKLFKNCPKWIPGEKNGEKVRTRFAFPIKLD
ncbi:MAG: energy transducer TonB [Flavobacterium sp.]|nr:energy transducer TonB [Flavobacterium sp.]